VIFGATPEKLGGSAALTRSKNTKAKGVIEIKRGEYSGTCMEQQDPAHKKAVLGRSRARVAIEVAVDLGWERYIGLEGRFVACTASAPQAKSPTFKKSDINADAAVRAAHETIAEVAAPLTRAVADLKTDKKRCGP
jgi:transketolase